LCWWVFPDVEHVTVTVVVVVVGLYTVEPAACRIELAEVGDELSRTRSERNKVTVGGTKQACVVYVFAVASYRS